MKTGIPLAVIVGPTAVGKSRLAVEVAGKLDGEIVSADSMQVYRGMDIATAKIRTEEMTLGDGRIVPHHLLDICDPSDRFSVADFQGLARETIQGIASKGRLPVLAGGTGLYVRAVIDPYAFLPEEATGSVRQALQEEALCDGGKALFRRLSEVDPETARRLHPNDLRRVIRALEVYQVHGQPLSRLRYAPAPDYRLGMVGLTMERSRLYALINRRVDAMVKDGVVEEVESLLASGVSPEAPAMQGLGYYHLVRFLQGEISLEDALEFWKRDTRRYAKRQFTWFGRDKRLVWFEMPEGDISPLVGKITVYLGRTILEAVE